MADHIITVTVEADRETLHLLDHRGYGSLPKVLTVISAHLVERASKPDVAELYTEGTDLYVTFRLKVPD